MENQIQTFVIISSIVFAVFLLTALYLFVKLILNSAKLKKSEDELKGYNEGLTEMVKMRTIELEESQQNFQSLYEQHLDILDRSPAGIIRLDERLNIVYINTEMKNIIESSGSNVPFAGDSIKSIKLLENSIAKTFFHNLLNGHHFNTDPIAFTSQGDLNYIILKGVPSITDGIFTGAVVLVSDITRMKKAEAEINRNLQEKNTLLKEVHHRVKNNMQVIISMLKLQNDFIEDPRALELSMNSMNRVRSMAMVHDRLYRAENLSSIDFSEYTNSLSGQLFYNYNVMPSIVEIEKKIENIFLNINTAVPFGLIVNELLSNALKHGFPNDKKGLIKISLVDTGKNFIFKIHNNGLRPPEDFDIVNPKGLGMQLVNSLTIQLHGNLEYKYNEGPEFTLTFIETPISTYQEM